jgi:hypothetical protein
MFAMKQKLCTAIPMDPPSQCLQEPLLEKSNNEKYTKVHQHEKSEEEPSHVGVSSPILANIQSYSFLLGLMLAFFALSAQVLTLAFMVTTLFSRLSRLFTSVIITFIFIRASDRLIDPSEENKTIIMWHIKCRFGFGTLIGVYSAWVLINLLLGMDGHIKHNAGMLVGDMMLSLIFKTFINRHIECRFGLGTPIGVCSTWVLINILLRMDGHIKYSAGTLVGVIMVSLIFQFWCSANKHRQVTLFGSLVETNTFLIA